MYVDKASNRCMLNVEELVELWGLYIAWVECIDGVY